MQVFGSGMVDNWNAKLEAVLIVACQSGKFGFVNAWPLTIPAPVPTKPRPVEALAEPVEPGAGPLRQQPAERGIDDPVDDGRAGSRGDLPQARCAAPRNRAGRRAREAALPAGDARAP